MSSEDFAYLAGVMDGDGSFGIHKLSSKRSPLYFPILQCSTWRSFIHILQKTFGGCIVNGKIHICKDGSKGHSLMRWKLRSANNVRPALEKLIPFLRIKKDRAIFLHNFIDENPFVRGEVLSQEILEKREKSYIKMIQYNEWKSCSNSITANSAKIMSENKEFWAYTAGLMDTDGSFALKKQVQNKGTDVKNPRYIPCILIGMTDTRAINYIRENCNVGKLCIPKNRCTNAGYHFQYGIYCKNACIKFLKRVIPYLRSKKEQAEILLNFCENSKNTKICVWGIPEDELDFREKCYQMIKQLNKYGVYKPSLIDLEARQGDKGQA